MRHIGYVLRWSLFPFNIGDMLTMSCDDVCFPFNIWDMLAMSCDDMVFPFNIWDHRSRCCLEGQ